MVVRLSTGGGDKEIQSVSPSTVESLRERISKASSSFNDFDTADNYIWVIKSGDEIAGHVTVQNVNRMMLTAEIGYGISARLRGQGIGTRTIKKFSELIAFVHEGNVPSRKLLEKAGFHQEGLLRDHYLVSGKPCNEVIYGLLRRDLSLFASL